MEGNLLVVLDDLIEENCIGFDGIFVFLYSCLEVEFEKLRVLADSFVATLDSGKLFVRIEPVVEVGTNDFAKMVEFFGVGRNVT